MRKLKFISRSRPLIDWIISIMLFLVGWFLSRTNMFTVIHEFFHWVVAKASGLDVFFVSPLMVAVKNESDAVIMAGWFGEIILYSVASITLSIIGINRLFPSGALALALAYTAFIHSFWSKDFGESLLHSIKDRFPGQKDSLLIAIYEQTQAWIFKWIVIVGIVCLSISSIVVLYCLVRKARRLQKYNRRQALMKRQFHGSDTEIT